MKQPHTRPQERHIAVERTARYFTFGPAQPSTADDLWIVVHGYSQLAGEFIRYFADLDTGRRVVIAPEALNRFYTASIESAPAAERPVGATWMTREDRDREIADYCRYIDILYESITADWTPARTIVVGFSQGAATASRWVSRTSVHVDELVLWGGLLPPEIDPAAGPGIMQGASVTLVAGSSDQYIKPEALERERARIAAGGFTVHSIGFTGGHGISRSALASLTAHIDRP